MLEALRRLGLRVDSHLEKLLALTVETQEDPGIQALCDTNPTLRRYFARAVLLTVQAYAANGDMSKIIAFLDESTIELALREVERQEQRSK